MPTNWDEEEFWRKAAEKAAARKKRYGKARKAKQPEKPKGTSNDVRDKFIYGHAMKGVPWLRIRILLAKSKRWCDDPLAYKDGVRDVSGVRKAAFRYAKTHGLPEPPKRQAGRPST